MLRWRGDRKGSFVPQAAFRLVSRRRHVSFFVFRRVSSVSREIWSKVSVLLDRPVIRFSCFAISVRILRAVFETKEVLAAGFGVRKIWE